MKVDLVQDARAMIGEGPVWDDRSGRLYWVDIPVGRLHRFSPSDLSDLPIDFGQPVGSVGLGANGGVAAALRDGFALVPSGEEAVTMRIDVESEITGNRMNDGRCDQAGRFWAGTMASPWEGKPGCGSMYCLEETSGTLAARRLFGPVTVSNGIDWSGDGRRLYYIDSATQQVAVFDFDVDSGVPRNRRTFVDIPPGDGFPDGMMVDADDCVWVALFGAGRLRRYTPAGTIDREVVLPVTLVTSMAFGGSDLGDLYVTTAKHRLTAAQQDEQVHAGGLYCCRPGPVGRPPYRFHWV
jgi:sugar lactone lactonase YvrE